MSTAFQLYEKLLQSYLGFNLSRIHCLTMLVEGLVQSRTVNLALLAPGMAGRAKVGSHYMRLRRFMKEVVFDYRVLARMFVFIMDIPASGFTLILDRTNWKFGKLHINILYLAVAWRGMAIPLFGPG
jgi:hypothetical protein